MPARTASRRSTAARKPRKSAPARRPAAKDQLLLQVATVKGLWWLRSGDRRTWKLTGPQFLGHVIHHAVLDPRDRRTLLVAAKTGHLGPTVFRSTDFGKTWKEASQPPAFPKAADGSGKAVDHVFFLAPAHPSEPNVWYAGTSPHGLFRTEDGGVTWQGVKGFNDSPNLIKWGGGPNDAPPEGQKTHSIQCDPRDARRLWLGMSAGGVFVSENRGASWTPVNRGSLSPISPDQTLEFGQDPHLLVVHPANPDRLYQQNHCGIYRLDRPGDRWDRIGNNMPKAVGDIGFPIVAHPRDPDTCWVFPMDGTQVWPRTSPGGKPAVYVTRNGGKTWQKQNTGLPKEQGWFTVFRQAFCSDERDPLGLYFGTTCGQVWASRDEGKQWKSLVEHLPKIYALQAIRL